MHRLLRMCNVTSAADLPNICDVSVPLSRDRARSTIEMTCLQNAKHLCFRSPRISHTGVARVLGLDFYSNDLYGAGDAINLICSLIYHHQRDRRLPS